MTKGTPRVRRWLRNAFIVTLLILFAIDTFPSRHPLAERAREAIDPILDVTGLWQGPWELFSPEVDRQNHRLEMVAVYPDGSEVTWEESPDWKSLGAGASFVRVREIEYYDRVRGEGNAAAQKAWVKALSRARLGEEQGNSGEPGGRPESVELRIEVMPLSSPKDYAEKKPEPEIIRATMLRAEIPPPKEKPDSNQATDS